MAKKPSGKAAGRSKRPTKPKAAAAKKTPAVTKSGGGRAEKYEQPGAPWWKRHLPG
jgi:hypothetical protein